ncbi:TNT domain-containing protein [Sphaerisporangium sp. NPDC051017]|uniref:TNT domain-containing protein n=1 Tax=Sphaerisporangium sp. NPDC051017 TaxID=3154636 RepID=UPI0034250802
MPEFAPIDQEDPLRNFRRRASLAAAIGITALSLAGVPAQAGTRTDSVTRTASVHTAVPVAPVASAHAVHAPGGDAADVAVSQSAGGTSTPDEPVCAAPYINEDPRLGPMSLPRKGILGRILADYEPLGGLPPQKFLNRYWDWGKNSYRYPPDFGFAHSGGYSNGRPLIASKTLRIGERVDRFGSEFGAFLAPYGTPYAERSIPPTNLDTFPDSPEYPCNYRAYRVSRDFAADFGPIASAFQQPGGGSQYHLVSRLIAEAPQTRDEVPVKWLVDNGYLERIN